MPVLRSASGRTRWIDTLTVGAVVLVVVLVSLPRLHEFALRENEDDAIRLVRAVADALESMPPEQRTTVLSELCARKPTLVRRFDDAEFLSAGTRAARHGYFIDLRREPGGTLWVRAWPARHGETGHASFLCEPGGPLLCNLEAPPGLEPFLGVPREVRAAENGSPWRMIPRGSAPTRRRP